MFIVTKWEIRQNINEIACSGHLSFAQSQSRSTYFSFNSQKHLSSAFSETSFPSCSPQYFHHVTVNTLGSSVALHCGWFAKNSMVAGHNTLSPEDFIKMSYLQDILKTIPLFFIK